MEKMREQIEEAVAELADVTRATAKLKPLHATAVKNGFCPRSPCKNWSVVLAALVPLFSPRVVFDFVRGLLKGQKPAPFKITGVLLVDSTLTQRAAAGDCITQIVADGGKGTM